MHKNKTSFLPAWICEALYIYEKIYIASISTLPKVVIHTTVTIKINPFTMFTVIGASLSVKYRAKEWLRQTREHVHHYVALLRLKWHTGFSLNGCKYKVKCEILNHLCGLDYIESDWINNGRNCLQTICTRLIVLIIACHGESDRNHCASCIVFRCIRSHSSGNYTVTWQWQDVIAVHDHIYSFPNTFQNWIINLKKNMQQNNNNLVLYDRL